MLPARTEIILNSIIRDYITRAAPVSSQSIASGRELGVSSATIRNEMARLEQEGYISRPYPSSGSIPLDKGYRHYVEALSDIELPLAEQRLISHLFHQVEKEMDKWLSLTVTLMAQLVKNMAIATMPKPADCQFKHMEAIVLQGPLTLVVLVLRGARIKEEMITLNETASQAELTASSNKLNEAYSRLTSSQIQAKDINLSPAEQQITDCLVKMMREEDEKEYEEPYLNGWHFMLNQPEFAHSQQTLSLMELVERRELLKSIALEKLPAHEVLVLIGRENKAEAICNCSVVISRYGLPHEAMGTIGIIGPTRMHYTHVIPAVGYLASVLTGLVTELYS